MQIQNTVAIVTGAGRGIGAAIAQSLVRAGACVVLSDLDADAVADVARRIQGSRDGAADLAPARPENSDGRDTVLAHSGDCSDVDYLAELISAAEEHFGPVDIFCANAGIMGGRGLDTSEDEWSRAFDVNVLAHVRAAKLLVPGWLERGRGYFVTTASAAGLLTQLGSAPYALSKHAAVAFAEWLSITYGDRGVRVSCLCPLGVNTALLTPPADDDRAANLALAAVTGSGPVLEPSVVGDLVVEAIADERFLILPHPEVLTHLQRKTGDYDRWLAGMRRFQNSLGG